MKKLLLVIAFMVLCSAMPIQKAQAQIPVVSLITSAIKKVITAIDLKVQQLQNQTIMLQNAEQNLENRMSLGNLNDISGWLNKERNLYQSYYKELATVKTVISDYDEVKRIISQQEEIVWEYKNARSQFSQDKHFSSQELNSMGNVYNGIMQESIRNLDEVLLAVKSFSTQMSDAERLLLVHKASAGMQKNLNDLRQFNNNNITISLERAQGEHDRENIKQLYGLPN